MLTLTPLEPRESPVGIDWWFDPHPWVQANSSTIREAVEPLAALFTRPDVPVLRVRVEPDPQPGALADGTPYTWPGGGRIRFDPDAPAFRAGGISVGAVAQHEWFHVMEVVEHSFEWDSLVSFHRVPVTPLDVPSPGDVAAAEAVGWTYTLPPEPAPYTEDRPYRGPFVTVACPWGEGWAKVPPKVAEQWGLKFTPEVR